MTEDPDVIAHRGFAGMYPENTIRAITEAAAREETVMVEIDVQPAACGTPVVYHDDRLDSTRDGKRTTDAEGLVRETPLDDLTETRVLGTEQTIPTLEAALGSLPESVGVNVELKNPGSSDLELSEPLDGNEVETQRERWAPFVEEVATVCDAFGGGILFSSFYEGALAAARDVAPDYPIASLIGGSIEDGLEVARRYDCEAVHPPRNAVRGTSLAGESYGRISAEEPEIDILEVARDEGRTVNVWTVETWVQYEQLAEAGVDGIVAEYPGFGSTPTDY